MNRQTELIWKALADSTRRKILDILVSGPKTTGQLSAAFPFLSRFGVMKHLNLLQESGLLSFKREGKQRWNYLNAGSLNEILERGVQWGGDSIQLENKKAGTVMADSKKSERDVSSIHIELKFKISAPVSRVWNALVNETNLWWPRDFYANPESKAFFLEPRLGGRMYEDAGNGTGVLWYTVIAIDPPNSIDLSGHLTPAFGGPATSLLRLQLAERENATILHLTDALIGRLSPNAKTEIPEGWKVLLENGLKRFVEENSALL